MAEPLPLAELTACSFERWYPSLRKHSIPSTVLPLTSEFVEYLKADGVAVAWGEPDGEDDGGDGWDDEEAEAQPPAPRFAELELAVEAAISRHGGAVLPKLNWSAPTDAAWMLGGSLRCTRPPSPCPNPSPGHGHSFLARAKALAPNPGLCPRSTVAFASPAPSPSLALAPQGPEALLSPESLRSTSPQVHLPSRRAAAAQELRPGRARPLRRTAPLRACVPVIAVHPVHPAHRGKRGSVGARAAQVVRTAALAAARPSRCPP